VAISFAALVWPTMYRPLELTGGPRTILAARQHRVTGRVDILTLEGWRSLEAESKHYSTDNPFSHPSRVDTAP
jgi:hypothetical protein